MQQEPDINLRFALIEARIAELERFKQSLNDRDAALLARVDGFIDDLRRLERNQMTSFDALKSEMANMASNMNLLAQGQAAIIAMLQQQGQGPKRND